MLSSLGTVSTWLTFTSFELGTVREGGYVMAKVVGGWSTDPKDFKPGLYRHYKGSDYRALFIVYHHDTEEAFVVYISYAHPAKIRLREYATPGKDSWTDLVQADWNEMVRVQPVSSSSDGHVYNRFEYIGP